MRSSFAMQPALFSQQTAKPGTSANARKTRLTEDDAVDVWIARWLHVRRKNILARYGCDSRRLYEIWTGEKHPGAKAKARKKLLTTRPELADRIDFGDHRRIPRGPDPERQLALFDAIR